MSDKEQTNSKTRATGPKKESVSAEPTVTADEPVIVRSKHKRSWNIGAMFWGLLLIAVGVLLLLGNLGIVDVNWSELWRLWPLLIIATGFSVLAKTHWVWKVLSLAFIIVAFLAVLWVGTGHYGILTDGMSIQNATVKADQGVTAADVTVKAGASGLTIDSTDMADVVQAKLESNGLQLKSDAQRDGTTQRVVLSATDGPNLWVGPPQNNWGVTLTERLPMKLTIDAGASNVNADVSKVHLTDLSVKAGASSTVITLGDKEANLNVAVDSGASSTTLRIPKDSGVVMHFEGGLSSRVLEGLMEISKGEYRSQDYETATNRISITVDAGLALFRIERY